MYKVLLPLALAGLSATALAETTLIDTSVLPAMQVYDVAELTPLAVSAAGAPAVVLLDLDNGDVVPPHATESGLRLLTVLSGEMSWGDGSTIDQTQETVYPAGSILTLPAGQDHWLAARGGDVRLQLIVLDDENAVPEVLEQMR
ncbi:MAG: hypothetical protein AAFX92_00445 [Pseudomonadota bacterium]